MENQIPPEGETDILAESNLDESQKKFCLDHGGKVRLLAPAGSGKTYSLLWRCLAVSQKTSDNKIPRFLVFTFTRAARDELLDRLHTDNRFQQLLPLIEITTLNSWGFRRLRKRLKNLRLITKNSERYNCITNTLKPIWTRHIHVKDALTNTKRGARLAREVVDIIDAMKTLGFRHDKHSDIDSFLSHVDWLSKQGMQYHFSSLLAQLKELQIISDQTSPTALFREAHNNFVAFWCDACAHLYDLRTLTLEDQKYWELIEIERDLPPGKSIAYEDRKYHILVDEFQDINTLDLNLLKAIARMYGSDLCIVGDDDQAIFEWRGATPSFILEPDTFIGPSYRSHVLEANYRSPRNIVELSSKLIKHNKRRVPKKVKSASNELAIIDVLRMNHVDEAIQFVLDFVQKTLSEETETRNIALIGRKRSQIIPYQIVFAGNDIPFYAAEDLQIFLSDAFEELKSILTLKANLQAPPPLGPDPVESLLGLCDKVKRYTIKKDERCTLKNHLLSANPRNFNEALKALYSYQGPLKGSNTGGTMSAFFYSALKELAEAPTVSDSIRTISSRFEGLQKDYGKSLDDIFYIDPPFLYLSDYARRYAGDYRSFVDDIQKAVATLAEIAQDTEVDSRQTWKRRLHLMTALRAKGKEFDNVIILDCNAGVWPSKLALTEEELESERRLFYVAFTRARKRLILLLNHSILGDTVAPSPYLAEMELTVTDNSP